MSEPTRSDLEWQQALVGYHLGLCDPDERNQIAAHLRNSPAARRAESAVQRALAPLDCYAAPPPAALAERVLDRLNTGRTLRLPPARPDAAVGRSTLSMHELLSLAAAVLLFAGVLLPAYQQVRRSAVQHLCQDQLRNVGTALTSYADASNGFLPFNGAAVTTAGLTLGRGLPVPRTADHVQLLREANLVRSGGVLNCPAGDASGGPPRYNFQLWVVPQNVARLAAQAPIAGDPNPLIRDGIYLPAAGLRNSDAHGPNAGQMILDLDGSAGWRTRPNVGVAGDDVFRPDEPSAYRPTANLRVVSDSFLVP